MSQHIETTTDFVINREWTSPRSSYVIDPIGLEPDRFSPMSGKGNYRSGALASFEQLKMLKKKYGIKRIVNLALDSMAGQKDERFNCGGIAVPCEPLWAEELGLEYYPVYLHTKPPSETDWAMIKELLAEGNTLIHCTHGVDRTGAVAAAWRKTLEPELTDDEVLRNYTYKFGGAWLGQEDSNRYLREWVRSTQFDPVLLEKTLQSYKMSVPMVLFVLSGITGIGIGIYRFISNKRGRK